MTEFVILYEDAEALVIDKPSGLPVDRPRAGGPSLDDRLDELRLGFQRQPSPVHRLDQDTSGCLLLARHHRALKRYSAAFEARQVKKTYWGVIAGEIEGEKGTIALSLAKISSEEGGWHMIPARKGKEAVTHWRVLARKGALTLVEFTPETGRTHQIRIHAAAGLGHALLGDPVYGRKIAGTRTMLHAARLVIPREGKPDIVAQAPMPADFVALGFVIEPQPVPAKWAPVATDTAPDLIDHDGLSPDLDDLSPDLDDVLPDLDDDLTP